MSAVVRAFLCALTFSALLLPEPWPLAQSLANAATPAQTCKPEAPSYDVQVPGRPFSVVELPSGAAAFAAVNADTATRVSGVAVLLCKSGRLVYSHTIALSPQPTGIAITRDGKLLVVADDAFIAFVDTAAAVAGRAAVLGAMKAGEGDIEDDDPSAIFTSISPDDRFAFVSEESNRTISVIDLAKARASGYARSALVGEIPVGIAPISTVFAPDGRTMFATSEVALKKFGWSPSCREEGSPADSPRTQQPGAIFAIDVATAERDPANAVRAKIPGECSPVRMDLSADGKRVWVSNRGSDSASAFDTRAIEAGDSSAKTTGIPVGSNPVAIAATRDGKYVLVGITNRFGPGGTNAGHVAVIDAQTNAVVGAIPSGLFPRQFSRGSGTTLFLANNRSDSITVFDESKIGQLVR